MASDVLALNEFLTIVKDGEEHGWEAEIDFLCEEHPKRLVDLMLDIRRNGIQEPIHIGADGRCWDGHHRVTAAYLLGLDAIPVRDDRAKQRDGKPGRGERDDEPSAEVRALPTEAGDE